MRAHRFASRLFTGVLLVAGLLLAPACGDLPTDAALTEEPQAAASDTTASSKVHLFELSDLQSQDQMSKGGLLDIGIIVGFRDSTVSSSGIASRYGIASRFEYNTVFDGLAGTVGLLELPGVLAGMIGDDDVAWVEPDLNLSVIDALVNTTLGVLNLTTNTLFGILQTKQVTPWSITAIEGHRSWTRSGNGSGSVNVDVYVFDTGANHADLNVTECLDFTHGDVRSCGLLSGLDLNAHGTAVAGAAAALDNRNGVVGVAPGARVHVLKVLGDDGTAPFSRIIAAIEYLTERKLANPSAPMVANVSLGANIYTTHQSSLDRAMSASIDQGITYVVAAGNENINAATVTPAHVPEAITVGSFDKYTRFSRFSNFGSVVDILAPGEDVQSLTSGNAVNHMSGTSIAAPYVTGAAALLLARHPGLSPKAVRAAIVSKSHTGVRGTPSGTTDRRLNVRYLQ